MNSPLQRVMDDPTPTTREQHEVCVDIVLSGNDELHFVSVGDDIKKEKRKGGSSAKKPPRPPQRALISLDAAAADQLELAMIKRARMERMRALLLQKSKPSKASSATSHTTNLFAIIFTIIVCILVLFQGMSCQISCGTFQGSPPPLDTNEIGLIFIHEHDHQELNPSAHDSV